MKHLFLWVSLSFLAVVCRAADTDTFTVWLMFHRGSSDVVMTSDFGERDKLRKNDWRVNGTGRMLSKEQKGAVAVYRLVRATPKGAIRMFTVNKAEAQACLKAGYGDEGIVGYAAIKDEPGEIPVYRLSKDGKSVWLMAGPDREWAEDTGWKYEGIAFWVWTPKSE